MEDLRCYLTAKGRKRFEVYVCTMAERDYAFEMWRLLDPEAHLIGSKQLLDRVVCVKSGMFSFFYNILTSLMLITSEHKEVSPYNLKEEHVFLLPRLVLIVVISFNVVVVHFFLSSHNTFLFGDGVARSHKVWEDKDQPRVHVVPAFTPYYAPQAETANAVPVLCVARNVACNVRGCFFKEFDENLLLKINEVFFEDEVGSLPQPQMMLVLCQMDVKSSVDLVTDPCANHVEFKPEISQLPAGAISNAIYPFAFQNNLACLGPPIKHDGSSVDHDYDVKKGLSTTRHGPDIRFQIQVTPSYFTASHISIASLRPPHGGRFLEDDISSKTQLNIRPTVSLKESNVVRSENHQPQMKPFSHGTLVALSNALVLTKSQVKGEVLSAEDGVSQVHLSSNNREFQSESGKLNLLPSLSIGVLQEIGKKCNSKASVSEGDNDNNLTRITIGGLFLSICANVYQKEFRFSEMISQQTPDLCNKLESFNFN
ncbi:RNA polymerase II C-terminal domain phosphatase-like 2 isoform X1 [Senna tora]|uniref:protein-serine/threonine phosphatase n=1 Tax=Senna tora TaxID=362788 RepID=A0A834WYJ0_9FABA|nr:RNA polymerase II C-terminal domain phosphatase-like 2 isoform X1 [Senna tora]